jgi:putative membrane protein
MMYGWDGWSWGGWIVMVVAMTLFWAFVITGVVLAIRYVVGGSGHANRRQTSGAGRAEEVLAERFARGELDEDEFRRRMTAIREHLPS